MARFEATIEVAAPLEDAFRYVADFKTVAEWDPGIVQSRRVDNGPIGKGATYDVIALFRGKRVPFRYQVTDYEEYRRLVLLGKGAKAQTVDRMSFGPAGDGAGTRIHYAADLTLNGVRRLAEPFVAGWFRDAGERAVAGLRTKLDAAR